MCILRKKCNFAISKIMLNVGVVFIAIINIEKTGP